MKAAMDTNVLVAGLRSKRGASNEMLSTLRAGKWTLVLSNTVLGEYHEVLHREASATGLSRAETDAYLDAICALAEKWLLGSEWRPVASDPDDEPIVQLAREAKVPYLVTHNVRDMQGATKFGVQVVRPAEFLAALRRAA